MFRPARLAAAAACAAAALAAVGASPALAGTATLTIDTCTLAAPSTGTPPSPVTVSASGSRITSCTVSGASNVSGNLTADSRLTTQADGSITADVVRLQVRATVLIIGVTCNYRATNVNLPLASAGPPTWTYSGSATAALESGSSLCPATFAGSATVTVTP
jgi:hypothetical protein